MLLSGTSWMYLEEIRMTWQKHFVFFYVLKQAAFAEQIRCHESLFITINIFWVQKESLLIGSPYISLLVGSFGGIWLNKIFKNKSCHLWYYLCLLTFDG